MLIAAGVLIQFMRFMQITLLIILPLLAAAIGITAFIHYRRKKRKTEPEADTDVVQQLITATPDGLNYEHEDADYVHYDQSGLIREYKSKLIYSHARYTALQQDYDRLRDKCDALLTQIGMPLPNIKQSGMKDLQEIQDLSSQDNGIKNPAAIELERNELQARLDQVNSLYHNLEKENQSLTEQVGLLTATDGEKASLVNRWQEENAMLRDKVAEQEYLRDIVEEKKMQIEFLQQQLEQRIRNYHQSEKLLGELTLQIEQANRTAEEARISFDASRNEFLQKEEQSMLLQRILNEKEELLAGKNDTITWLENTLEESRQQSEVLNAMAADNNDLVLALQEAMAGEQLRVVHLEQKLQSNKQLLKRLYHELSLCVEEEADQSPVIELKPAYISQEKQEWQETMV